MSNKGKRFNAKLTPKYAGPFKVRKVHSPVMVDIRDQRGKWHRQVHVQNLKPGSREATTEQTDPEDNEDEQNDRTEEADDITEADAARADDEADDAHSDDEAAETDAADPTRS